MGQWTTGCPGDTLKRTTNPAVARAPCPWKPLYLQESRDRSQTPSLSSVSRDGGAHGLPPPSSTGIRFRHTPKKELSVKVRAAFPAPRGSPWCDLQGVAIPLCHWPACFLSHMHTPSSPFHNAYHKRFGRTALVI